MALRPPGSEFWFKTGVDECTYTPIRCYLIPWSSSVFLRASTRHKFNYTTNKKISYVSEYTLFVTFLKKFLVVFFVPYFIWI